MFDNRGVSRERVIGISFVDILVQAVFVLLLVLMVGYVDPVEKTRLEEYEQIGKDICTKLNKDSIAACREVLEKKTIAVASKDPFQGVGDKVCTRLGKKDANECIKALDRIVENPNLWPCIASTSRVKAPPSTNWVVHSPNEVEFGGFSTEYVKYLQEKGDSHRLALVQDLRELKGKIVPISEIPREFSFIKEPGCFHELSVTRIGAYSDSQLNVASRAIYSLRGFSN